MTINDVNTAIMFGDFTSDQLNSIVMAVKYRRAQMVRDKKRGLRVGYEVKWYSPKRGRNFQGRVTKIATKFVTVDAGRDGAWRVPADMLEAV
jgi:hypothetical protein